jgi:hypothetical protein
MVTPALLNQAKGLKLTSGEGTGLIVHSPWHPASSLDPT